MGVEVRVWFNNGVLTEMDLNGFRGLPGFVFLAGVLFFCGCSGQGGGFESGDVRRDFWSSAKYDLSGLPDNVLTDSKSTFLRADNMTALLLAGGASVVMHNDGTDAKLADDFRHNRKIDGGGSDLLGTIGGPGFHFAATGLWYALSVENGDDFNRQRSWTMIRALSTTGFWTVGLKAARNNKTPNGKRWGWPSGHTSSSFTVASVLDEFYGPKVGIPAYGVAGLVAYRMMDEGDHWASDVVFGAVLGWVVGHTVAGENKDIEVAGFEVLPFMTTSRGCAGGITLRKRF